MRIEFHPLDLVESFEYWCGQCETLNLSFVPLKVCPVCSYLIVEFGKIGELKTRAERA